MTPSRNYCIFNTIGFQISIVMQKENYLQCGEEKEESGEKSGNAIFDHNQDEPVLTNIL